MSTADKGRQREDASESNIKEEATKQNKGAENSKEIVESAQKLEPGAITKTTCDPKAGWEQTGEKLIPENKTKGTACDLTLDPAAGGGNHNSALCNRGPH